MDNEGTLHRQTSLGIRSQIRSYDHRSICRPHDASSELRKAWKLIFPLKHQSSETKNQKLSNFRNSSRSKDDIFLIQKNQLSSFTKTGTKSDDQLAKHEKTWEVSYLVKEKKASRDPRSTNQWRTEMQTVAWVDDSFHWLGLVEKWEWGTGQQMGVLFKRPQFRQIIEFVILLEWE